MQPREIIRFGAVQDIAAVNSQGMFQYPSHWHNEAECILALRDACIYRIGETEYRLSEGDLLLVWPREMHELISIQENGTMFIQFSAGLLESNQDLAIAVRMLSTVHHLKHSELPDLTEKLAGQMREMMRIYQSDDFFRETRCKLLVYQMILLVAEHELTTKMRHSEAEQTPGEAWTRMRQACAYIEAHYTENLHQADVAHATGLSPWYFSRMFRQYVSSSFPEYLARVRVHAARRLLANNSLTITECAYQAGFQSTTAFNKAFAEWTGCTPREYRRTFL